MGNDRAGGSVQVTRACLVTSLKNLTKTNPYFPSSIFHVTLMELVYLSIFSKVQVGAQVEHLYPYTIGIRLMGHSLSPIHI